MQGKIGASALWLQTKWTADESQHTEDRRQKVGGHLGCFPPHEATKTVLELLISGLITLYSLSHISALLLTVKVSFFFFF